MSEHFSRQSWAVERSSGNANAPWQIIHRATGLPVPVLRPYPGVEDLPPIWVQNHRSRQDAERAAAEIDWPTVHAALSTPEGIEAGRRYREKKAADEAYQHALREARAGREPWPWESGGLLHRNVVPLKPDEPMTLFDAETAA